jgi:hypothetical protein
MADVTAPPTAPPDIVWINMSKGKAKAILAKALVPSCPIIQTSAKLTED